MSVMGHLAQRTVMYSERANRIFLSPGIDNEQRIFNLV